MLVVKKNTLAAMKPAWKSKPAFTTTETKQQKLLKTYEQRKEHRHASKSSVLWP